MTISLVFAKHFNRLVEMVEPSTAVLGQITIRGEPTKEVTIRRFWIVDYIFKANN